MTTRDCVLKRADGVISETLQFADEFGKLPP